MASYVLIKINMLSKLLPAEAKLCIREKPLIREKLDWRTVTLVMPAVVLCEQPEYFHSTQ